MHGETWAPGRSFARAVGMAARLTALGALLVSGAARAVDREGSGRIGISGGLRLVPNNPFVQDARAAGYDVTRDTGLGPSALATFGYWIDSNFELSIEGGYGHDSYTVAGNNRGLTLDTETLMASLRWTFLTGYDIFPYLGASFGYSFNGVSSPFQAPWDNWTATGYGEVAMVGIGYDLSDHVGLMAELRYTISVLQSPLPSSLNAGGLSLLVGVYLRIPRASDNAIIPGSP